MTMCDCHPQTADDKKAWARVKVEPRTKEDWRDLHDTIEAHKRRLIERHAGPLPQEKPA